MSEVGIDVNQEYQKLTPIEHILKRSGMYLGSCENITSDCYVVDQDKMVKETITYNPALLKMFDEIISNSVDVHLKSNGLNKIWVEFSELTGEITIKDNGGIPVEMHQEGVYVPELIFCHLHAGSNFNDDDRQGAGMNGLGAKLTNIFSKQFSVETNDKVNSFSQVCYNNLSSMSTARVYSNVQKTGGTTISFIPDYDRLGCTLDLDNIKRLSKRVYDVAGCNPGISVYLNNQLIKLNSFEAYVKMYTQDKDLVIDQIDAWTVCISPSDDDSFEHISFVNGIDTFNGGTHVNYVCENIIYKVRDYILKKHKIEIKPNNIKQQMRAFIKCKINAPTFPSQTKEFLSTQPGNYGYPWSPSAKFMDALLKSEVVQHVLDWAEGEQRKAELAELKKINQNIQKQNYLKKILKFDDATSKDRSKADLFLTEGDSAAKPILSARKSETQGVFPLKGKMLNVRDVKIKKIIDNEEIHNLCAITGFQLGQDYDRSKLRFNRVFITADADLDGYHITGLFLNFINEFWPDAIKDGLIWRLRTPIMTAVKGKTKVEFLTEGEYVEWTKTNNPASWSIHYQKGLGGWSTKDFERFLHDEKYYQCFTADDVKDFASLDLAFDKKKADERKQWLAQ